MKISDNIFVVPGVMANTYVIVDADGLTVIDTGLPLSLTRRRNQCDLARERDCVAARLWLTLRREFSGSP